ncbi:hypothetical protein GUJ93_ZPchr0007g5844 [Zizania palustris]|uniref:Uncharacterized protein n=1 Tax=Zizania palustris TaxID=103762 RepID=A0A8J5T3P4_ZIZPA|nr:hypothetical protein GUJ93_ZPchr0007g5844 [Zizania palustris]
MRHESSPHVDLQLVAPEFLTYATPPIAHHLAAVAHSVGIIITISSFPRHVHKPERLEGHTSITTLHVLSVPSPSSQSVPIAEICPAHRKLIPATFATNFIGSRPQPKPPFGLEFIASSPIYSQLSILKSRRFSTLKIVSTSWTKIWKVNKGGAFLFHSRRRFWKTKT